MRTQPNLAGMHHRFNNNNSAFPLHSAVLNGNLPQIRSLLASGHNINQLDEIYGTPLQLSIWCNQLPAFEQLLSLGADPETLAEGIEEPCLDIPIRLAVRLGRREIVQRLWNAGLNRNLYMPLIPAYSQRSLIEIVSFEGYADVLQDLLEWSEEWTQEERDNALWIACRQWHADIVAVLLGHCDFSAKLLRQGMRDAATSWPSVRHITPEDSAGQATTMELLLDAHARSKDGTKTSEDPSAVLDHLLLLVSDSPFKFETMRLLLERGADPNVQDETDGKTPLHDAVRWGRRLRRCNEEGVGLLLVYGAKVDVVDKEGNTAVEAARKYGEEWMAQRLIMYGKEGK